MIPLLRQSLPLLPSLAFFALVLAFCWPAWHFLTYPVTHMNTEQATARNPFTRAALAFTLSFGVFSALSGPLLLLHTSTTTALGILLPTWLLAASWAIWSQRKQHYLEHANDSKPSFRSPQIAPSLHHTPASRTQQFSLYAALFLSLCLATATATELLPRRIGLALLAFSGCSNIFLALRILKQNKNCTLSLCREETPIFRRCTGFILLGLIAFALLSPAFHYRTDADDNLYLSETLVLQDATAMGLHAPTHRGEALPSNPIYAWQSFELWAALMARFSGLHPLILLRSLCGPLLFLLSMALYAELLRRILPRTLLLTALVFLAAYFIFGMSSQWTPNNYLLTRPQQGKTWLMHLGMAAMLLQSMHYLERPSWRSWYLLLFFSFACLGWAPTAVALVPAILGTCALAHLFQKPLSSSWRRLFLLLACAAPQVLFAIFLSTQQGSIQAAETLASTESAHWSDLFFFTYLNGGHGGGSLELATLVAAPLLLRFHPHSRFRAYPLYFSLALGLVILNPLLYHFLSDFSGGIYGYLRFFWLLPIPILLAALGAYFVHLNTSGPYPRITHIMALGLGLLVFPLSGAHFVWSSDNLYADANEGIYQAQVENPYKMPQGLLEIARALQTLPQGAAHRILCHPNEVMHLAPLVLDFDFVFARDFQTPPPLHILGRVAEAQRREKLSVEFLHGKMGNKEASTLLLQEKANYIILGPQTKGIETQLLKLGYKRRTTSAEFSLWVNS